MPEPPESPPRIAVTGASGLVGRALTRALEATGRGVHPLVRRPPRPDTREIRWDPETGEVDTESLRGFSAVVHLAGENIASGRWTPRRREVIRRSRVEGTRALAEALARMKAPPRTLLCASAVGYYGHRGDEVCTEESPPGEGFLPEVCAAWEAAADPAREAGIRVVHARIGVVLSREGGALPRMLPPFRLGLGGPVGSGKQWMSWIALDDLTALIEHCLDDPSLAGPVNAVAPHPAINREFAKTLGRVLRRPAVLPLPAFAVRLLLGEMGRDLLLASARAVPEAALRAGFAFRFPRLEYALRHVLGPPS